MRLMEPELNEAVPASAFTIKATYNDKTDLKVDS